MEEIAQGAPASDAAGASSDAGGSPPSGSTEASTSPANVTDSQSSVNVTTSPSNAPQDTETDIFAGLPSVDELKAQGEQGVQYAASLAQLRGALEDVSPKYKALAPYESIVQQFGDVERANQAAQALELHDALYGYDTGPQGQPVPSTAKFVEKISANPMVADNVTADLLFSQATLDGKPMTRPDGQPVSRLDFVLSNLKPEVLIDSLAQRKGYEDIQARLSHEAPQWTVSQDDLQRVKPEYHDTLRKMSPEEREELLDSDNDFFVNNTLRSLKSEADRAAEDERREIQAENDRQRDLQATEQAAVTAADAFVDKDIQGGLSGLIDSIAKDGLTDDVEVNRGVATIVGLAVAALAHRDFRPLAEGLLTELKVLDKAQLEKFDTPLQEWASNTRNAGYLRHKDPDAAVDTLLSRGRGGRNRTLIQANAIATRIMPLFSKLFTLQAEHHNAVLDGADKGRPIAGGQGLNTANSTQIKPSDSVAPFSPENNRRVVSTYR